MSCSDCGDTINQLSLVKQTLEALRMGHMMIAGVYRSIAVSAKEEDKSVYLSAAEHHEFLSNESTKMVIPVGAEAKLGVNV